MRIFEVEWNENNPLENTPDPLSWWGRKESQMIHSYQDIKKSRSIDSYSAAMLLAAQKGVTGAIWDYKVNNTPISGNAASYIVSVLKRIKPENRTLYRGVDREGYDDTHIMLFQSWAANVDTAKLFGRHIYKTVGPVKAVELSSIDYWSGLLYGGSNGLGDNQYEWFVLSPKTEKM
jgi:hypothetical protein